MLIHVLRTDIVDNLLLIDMYALTTSEHKPLFTLIYNSVTTETSVPYNIMDVMYVRIICRTQIITISIKQDIIINGMTENYIVYSYSQGRNACLQKYYNHDILFCLHEHFVSNVGILY